MFGNLPAWVFILVATLLESSGDAIVRTGIYNRTGLLRFLTMGVGAVCLFGYGFTLNLAPLLFGRLVGLYIATLFVMWQIVNFVAFHSLPNLSILVGGALIISGGLIITFWNPQAHGFHH